MTSTAKASLVYECLLKVMVRSGEDANEYSDASLTLGVERASFSVDDALRIH